MFLYRIDPSSHKRTLYPPAPMLKITQSQTGIFCSTGPTLGRIDLFAAAQMNKYVYST